MNGTRIEKPETVRGYITLEREWKAGDEIELYLPMPVERVAANPNVKADRGLSALQRGPLVYCLEACDQEAPLSEIYLPLDSELVTAKEPELLGGVVTLRGRGRVAANAVSWRHRLYQPVAAGRSVEIKAIPYYAWDNRQAGPMKVWLPSSPPAPMRSGLSAEASVSVSFANNNSQPSGINDGIEPRNSAEQPVALCHWWPHKGTTEWAQYEWKQAVKVNGAEVYWFDDTGRGECRLPASWKIEYRESGGGEWKAVKALNEYEVAKDRWCKVKFEPVTGTALRLVVAMIPDFAAGVHEWKVIEADEEN
jgi:hypothetical protein